MLVIAHLAQPGTVEQTLGVLSEVWRTLDGSSSAGGPTARRAEGEGAEEREYLLQAIRGLRVDAASFLDDGTDPQDRQVCAC